MGSIQFYLDEHIPKAAAKGLKQRGVEVFTCAELNTLGFSDVQHLTLAKENAWIMVTQDNDFLILHAQGFQHAGIVFITRPPSIGDLIHGLLLIHEVLEVEDMEGYVEFL
jgi:predicted nuclease of predicted toxin-antitoxin system